MSKLLMKNSTFPKPDLDEGRTPHSKFSLNAKIMPMNRKSISPLAIIPSDESSDDQSTEFGGGNRFLKANLATTESFSRK